MINNFVTKYNPEITLAHGSGNNAETYSISPIMGECSTQYLVECADVHWFNAVQKKVNYKLAEYVQHSCSQVEIQLITPLVE